MSTCVVNPLQWHLQRVEVLHLFRWFTHTETWFHSEWSHKTTDGQSYSCLKHALSLCLPHALANCTYFGRDMFLENEVTYPKTFFEADASPCISRTDVRFDNLLQIFKLALWHMNLTALSDMAWTRASTPPAIVEPQSRRRAEMRRQPVEISGVECCTLLIA